MLSKLLFCSRISFCPDFIKGQNVQHIDYIKKTISLATQVVKSPSPNPYVACLIVKNDTIIGQGIHQGSGTPHAEILALQTAGPSAKGADVYINIEPCCHVGKSSPCVNALINAKVKRVFCCLIDPNPLVSGKGIAMLNAEGIEVQVGFLETQARWINRFFIHYIQHKTPYVIAKWAMSLDGKMITHVLDNRHITNMDSHIHAHATRKVVDAILIGVNTALTDNPQLNVRYGNNSDNYQPLRIIVDRTGRLPIVKPPGKTLIITTQRAPLLWVDAMQQDHEVFIMPNLDIDLTALLKKLGQRNITSLLVEGGRTILNAFLNQELVQETHTYIGANIIANLSRKKHLHLKEHKVLGDNIFFLGESYE